MLKQSNVVRTSVGATALAGITAAGMLVGFTGESAAQAIKVGVVVPITSVLAPYGTPFVEVDEHGGRGSKCSRRDQWT